nr:arginine N-succinyltransferase [uncultured Roseateles sp.]
MTNWSVRPVQAADIATLAGWLPPTASLVLEVPAEHWLVAEQQGGDGAVHLRACLRLRQAIGLEAPRHWYHVGSVVHATRALQMFHRQTTLLLGNDLTGSSELADIGWERGGLDDHQQGQALQLLLRAALRLLVSGHDGQRLIVELPGRRDAQGLSPFWQGLGRHFYSGDTQLAAQRFGAQWRELVAGLLPRQPVHASFLPADAQAAIGQSAPEIEVLKSQLQQAGLHAGEHITIDDGGPVFEALVANYGP